MLDLYLIRGIPGSGKTTLAEKLCSEVYSADDFFMKDGLYKFSPTKLTEAHRWCQDRVEFVLSAGNDVVVANTFCERWEMEPYILMAKKHKARLTVIDLYDGGLTDGELASRNVHGVSVDGIQKMRQRYEHDWKNGSSIPPWERKKIEPPAPKPEPKPVLKPEPKPEPKIEVRQDSVEQSPQVGVPNVQPAPEFFPGLKSEPTPPPEEKKAKKKKESSEEPSVQQNGNVEEDK